MGYATEAVRALILHAFEKGGFDYLTVGHFNDNPASARIIAKLGFAPQAKMLRDCAARGGEGALPDLPARPRRALASVALKLRGAPLSPAGRGLG